MVYLGLVRLQYVALRNLFIIWEGGGRATGDGLLLVTTWPGAVVTVVPDNKRVHI